MPSCGDESNPFGAAYDFFKKNIAIKPKETVYLGFKYGNQEIDEFIQKNNLNQIYDIAYIENINETLSTLLAEGEIIARFSDMAEEVLDL